MEQILADEDPPQEEGVALLRSTSLVTPVGSLPINLFTGNYPGGAGHHLNDQLLMPVNSYISILRQLASAGIHIVYASLATLNQNINTKIKKLAEDTNCPPVDSSYVMLSAALAHFLKDVAAYTRSLEQKEMRVSADALVEHDARRL